MLFALGVVFVIYRLGQPDIVTWHDVFPGAAVATILWWIVDIGFGFYVRVVPYGTVYRGLAAVIGLLLWMYLTAMVIFMGAAYNAVTREGPFSDSHRPKIHLAVLRVLLRLCGIFFLLFALCTLRLQPLTKLL